MEKSTADTQKKKTDGVTIARAYRRSGLGTPRSSG